MTFIEILAAAGVLVLIQFLWAGYVQRVIGKGLAGFTVFMLGNVLTATAVCVTVIKFYLSLFNL